MSKSGVVGLRVLNQARDHIANSIPHLVEVFVFSKLDALFFLSFL